MTSGRNMRTWEIYFHANISLGLIQGNFPMHCAHELLRQLIINFQMMSNLNDCYCYKLTTQ